MHAARADAGPHRHAAPVATAASLPSRPRATDLGAGPEPGCVLDALAGEPGLACLWGEWGPGGSRQALIFARPVQTSLEPAALERLPELEREAVGESSALVGGGWLGWLGYDAASYFARYDHLLRWDESSARWSFEELWTQPRAGELAAARNRLAAVLAGAPRDPDGPGWRIGAFAGPDRAAHLAAVERAIELIRAGEIYQVNVCTRLGTTFSGSAARLFAAAASRLRPRFGAFVDSGARAVVCLSPELFLRREGRSVASSPIKGTWARDADDSHDEGALRLRESAKDIAENVMIVDLVRNDLGRVCRAGTVRAEQLLRVEPHPGVWHLMSTVRGELRPEVGDAGLLAATFPPGSVTGTPKLRAMRAITELEGGPRAAFTGALGLASPIAGLTLAVTIRTFEITRDEAGGRIELGVGGGITVDSVPELEWRECAQKAIPLLDCIGAPAPPAMRSVAAPPQAWQLAGGLVETILAVDGRVLRLADHLARLERSARELYGAPSYGGLAALAERVRVSVRATAGRYAIRVILAPSGEVRITAGAAAPQPRGSCLQSTVRAGVWRHKWADRGWIGPGESALEQPLYVDEAGHALETSRGNIFWLGPDGALNTPPLRDDLLPGITRRAVLDLARDCGREVRLRAFTVDEMRRAAAVFWTSSLSGLVPVTAIDGAQLRPTSGALDDLAAIARQLGFDARNPTPDGCR